MSSSSSAEREEEEKKKAIKAPLLHKVIKASLWKGDYEVGVEFYVSNVIGKGGHGVAYELSHMDPNVKVAFVGKSVKLGKAGWSTGLYGDFEYMNLQRELSMIQESKYLNKPIGLALKRGHFVTIHTRAAFSLEYIWNHRFRMNFHHLPPDQRITLIKRLIHDLCRGLLALQKVRTVHLDMKPANIFVDIINEQDIISADQPRETGHFQIGDFGIAMKLNEGEPTIELSAPGGSRDWWTSELLSNPILVGFKTDTAGVGGIAIWAVTGLEPSMIRARSNNMDSLKPLLTRSVGRGLADTMMRLVSPNPEDRPQLEAVLDSLGLQKEHLDDRFLWDNLLNKVRCLKHYSGSPETAAEREAELEALINSDAYALPKRLSLLQQIKNSISGFRNRGTASKHAANGVAADDSDQEAPWQDETVKLVSSVTIVEKDESEEEDEQDEENLSAEDDVASQERPPRRDNPAPVTPARMESLKRNLRGDQGDTEAADETEHITSVSATQRALFLRTWKKIQAELQQRAAHWGAYLKKAWDKKNLAEITSPTLSQYQCRAATLWMVIQLETSISKTCPPFSKDPTVVVEPKLLLVEGERTVPEELKQPIKIWNKPYYFIGELLVSVGVVTSRRRSQMPATPKKKGAK